MHQVLLFYGDTFTRVEILFSKTFFFNSFFLVFIYTVPLNFYLQCFFFSFLPLKFLLSMFFFVLLLFLFACKNDLSCKTDSSCKSVFLFNIFKVIVLKLLLFKLFIQTTIKVNLEVNLPYYYKEQKVFHFQSNSALY